MKEILNLDTRKFNLCIPCLDVTKFFIQDSKKTQNYTKQGAYCYESIITKNMWYRKSYYTCFSHNWYRLHPCQTVVVLLIFSGVEYRCMWFGTTWCNATIFVHASCLDHWEQTYFPRTINRSFGQR